MPNTRLCFARTSLSVALVASLLGLNVFVGPGFAQQTNDGVTVQKNSDGSVEAYDAGGSEEMGEDSGGGGGAAPNDGRVHYRPGTSPYSKKYADGTSVRRNSDGSIETWDEGETQHWSSGGGGGGSHKRSVKKSTKTATKKTTTTTVKKKAK